MIRIKGVGNRKVSDTFCFLSNILLLRLVRKKAVKNGGKGFEKDMERETDRYGDGLFTLADMCPGDCGDVVRVEHTSEMRRRLLDLGLWQGTPVRCVGESPLGDPAAYMIRGAVIALRRDDGEKILCRYVGAEDDEEEGGG